MTDLVTAAWGAVLLVLALAFAAWAARCFFPVLFRAGRLLALMVAAAAS